MDQLLEMIRKERVEIDAWRLREQGYPCEGSIQEVHEGLQDGADTRTTTDSSRYGRKNRIDNT